MKFERISKFLFQLTKDERETLEEAIEILSDLYHQMYYTEASFESFKIKDVDNARGILDCILDEGGIE